MRKIINLLPLCFISILLGSCSNNENDENGFPLLDSGYYDLFIASEKRICMIPFDDGKKFRHTYTALCKYDSNETWSHFQDNIKGFEREDGYEYNIRVHWKTYGEAGSCTMSEYYLKKLYSKEETKTIGLPANPPTGKTIVLTIASEMRNFNTYYDNERYTIAPYILAKEENKDENWQPFIGNIDDFQPEEGYEYKIRVWTTSHEAPIKDAYIIPYYRLEEIISKEKKNSQKLPEEKSISVKLFNE